MRVLRRTRHALESATVVTGARPAYAAGVRASIATVVPLAAGLLLGYPEAGTWMSLGGFNAALSDRGGSYVSRAGTMAVLAVSSALAATIGTLAAGHLTVSLVATLLIAFLASVVRAWGNAGISVGGATLISFVVALAIPPAQAVDAYARAGFVVLGVIWAMSIALVLWPLMPYRPARLAVSAVYDALAEFIELAAASVRAEHTTEWPVQDIPPEITKVRTALENAAEVLVQLRRGKPGKVDRGERLLILAESADQIFAHVVALGDTLAPLRGRARNEVLHEACITTAREIASTARRIARGVESEQREAAIEITWSGDDIREAIRAESAQGPVDPQYEHAAAVIDRASQFAGAAAVSVEELNGGKPVVIDGVRALPSRAAVHEELRDATSMLDSIRALLSPGSLIMRFSLRVAVVTMIAVAMTEMLELNHGYWMTITVIVIVQPYTGVTLTRAVQRVIGTVLGALLAVGLGYFFHDIRAVLVIATVFVACCVALLPLNYAAFSVFLTPTFVLLAEASVGDWNLAGTRVLNTLLGGALALAGARFLWPSPERERFPSYGALALRANSRYLGKVVERFDDTSHEAGEEMRAARRAVGLATVNAEESIQRALTEAHGERSKLAPALTLLAYTRRFTASVAALAIARHTSTSSQAAALSAFAVAACAAMEEIAAALEEGRDPAPLPELDAFVGADAFSLIVGARVERLARQLSTLHDAVVRLS